MWSCLSVTHTFKKTLLFVEQKPMLSCSFSCDRIHNNHWKKLCHAMWSCLSMTQVLKTQTLFVEQKLMLSCSFSCDWIHNNHWKQLCHAMWSCLSMTQVLKTQTLFVEQKLMHSCSFRCDQIHQLNERLWLDAPPPSLLERALTLRNEHINIFLICIASYLWWTL